MIARHVRVTGQVQGVFFRAWTRGEAGSLGVRGWVRNCSDGSVEAHLEGEESAVDELLQRMRRGPPDARVDELRAEPVQIEKFETFDLRH